MIRPFRCTEITKALFAFVTVLGITFTAPVNAANEKAAPDFSLNPNEYVKLGLPLPDQRWTAGDMTQAVQVLQNIAKTDPRKLPHYRSKHSGFVFARLTSPENLEPLYRDRSAPANARFTYAGVYYTAIGDLLDVYTDAAVTRSVSDAEIVELHGLHLRAIAVILNVAREHFATFKKGDERYEIEMKNYEQLKTTMANATNTLVDELKDRWLKPTSRVHLMEYLSETLPKIVPQLDLEMRSRNVFLIDKLIERPDLKNLQPSLVTLRVKVMAAIERNQKS